MLLEHLSREKAEAYVGKEPYAVISITDPDYPQAEFHHDHNRVAILRLQFHDFSQEPEEFKRLLFETAAKKPVDLEDGSRKWVLPSKLHAEAIVDFYRSLPPHVRKVVIHCEAGISRSAGVGAALAHCLGQTDVHFYHQSCPNHRVRRLVIQAWGRRS
jgi:predicted protein tyrosine phosphatase